MAKGRKHPAPRGYNPGGFRFPTRSPFLEQPPRFDGAARPDPVVSLGADVGVLAAISVATLAAARRRR